MPTFWRNDHAPGRLALAAWLRAAGRHAMHVAVALAVVGAAIGLATCSVWQIPSGPGSKYKPEDYGQEKYVIPRILLDEPTTVDAAQVCAVTANQFFTASEGDRFWAYVFGTLQVAGAGVGTAAGSIAFADGQQGKAAKVSVVSFAVAAGISALDQAYEPGKESARSKQVVQKIGHLILLAASQLATGDKKTAQITLASCQDPADVDDMKTIADIETIQAKINRMVAAEKQPDAGVVDGGAR